MNTSRAGRPGRVIVLIILAAVLTAAGVLGPAGRALATSAPAIFGTPPQPVLGEPYDFAFDVTGDPVPTCSVGYGELPPGLTLSADTCRLTGTVDVIGSWSFWVTVTNGIGIHGGLASTSVTLEIPWSQHATGTVGQPLSIQLTAPGVQQPVFSDPGLSTFVGLVLEPDGLVHGTPNAPVRSACKEYWVSGANVPLFVTVTLCLDITAADVPPAPVPVPPVDGTVGVPYSFQLVSSIAGVTWFVDGLPSGLGYDSGTGLLSGTPTIAGDFPLVVEAVGNLDETQNWVLHIADAPPVVTGTAPQLHSTPPSATLDQPYRFAFDTTGSAPAPTFSLKAGTLPKGLQLSADGVIAGTPTELGEGSPVTVRATNGVGDDAVVDITIPVRGIPISLTGTPPSRVPVKATYDFAYTLAGAPAPTTTVTDGVLPDGLSLDTAGHLTGTPTTPGSYTFTVTATDGGVFPDVPVRSTIVVTEPVQLTGTPGPARAGQPYSFAFTTSGYPAPTVRLSAGQLPAGLTLSPAGVLSGTSSASGTFPFTVIADNGLEQVSLPTSVTVAAVPTLSVTPTLSIADASVAEGNRPTRPETFRVTLSAPATARVTVRWETAAGTAKAGSDYVSGAGTLTFAPGETSKTVTVQVVGDRRHEPTERLSVRLSRAVGAAIGHGTAVGTVVDDD